jgi:Ankyrin repeats (3 copies)
MKSIRAQLLVTLVATAVAAGFFAYKGLPPSVDFLEAVGIRMLYYPDGTSYWCPSPRDLRQIERNIRWSEDVDSMAYGGTPLRWAVMWGDVELAEMLIAHGADVNVRDKDGRSLLQLAIDVRSTEIANLLRQHGARE